MGIINMVQTIKEIHKLDIVFVKIGNFYHVYGKDSYIISYLFEYKLKKVENVSMCGFPMSSINKIIAKLEENKINYLIVDRKNNYEVDEKSDNKNLSKYDIFFEKAKKFINLKIICFFEVDVKVIIRIFCTPNSIILFSAIFKNFLKNSVL